MPPKSFNNIAEDEELELEEVDIARKLRRACSSSMDDNNARDSGRSWSLRRLLDIII